MHNIILMLAIDWKSHQSGGLYKGLSVLFKFCRGRSVPEEKESLTAKTEIRIYEDYKKL